MPSTVIRSYKYLEDPGSLIIVFVSGKTYRYDDITKAEYEAFTRAFSKGTYFNRYIKPFHPFKELTV